LKINIDGIETIYENSLHNCKSNFEERNHNCEDCKKNVAKIEYVLETLSKFTLGRSNLYALISSQKVYYKYIWNWFYMS